MRLLLALICSCLLLLLLRSCDAVAADALQDELITLGYPAVPTGTPENVAMATMKHQRNARPALPAAAKGKPLVTLVMIIKNEIRSLAATLNSCLGWVDRYSIVDTGSTDGSDAFILSWFQEHLEADQWALHRRPFIDFSTTRNEALKLAGQESEFILFLNGDDSLVHGHLLRVFLEDRRFHSGIGESMYIVPVNYGGISSGRSERLSRSSNHFVPGWPNDPPLKHWRYEGVTHEVYVSQEALQAGVEILYVPDDSFEIFHDIARDTKEEKEKRFMLDIDLLLKEIESEPQRANHARSVFYLAQSYFNLDRFPEAFLWYSRRLQMNYPRPTAPNQDNEKSKAAALMAHMAPRLGKSKNEVIQLLNLAHSYCPTAYSSLQLARFHLYALDDVAQAESFARQSGAWLRDKARTTSMACGDDGQLVHKQLPTIMQEIRKEKDKQQKQKNGKRKGQQKQQGVQEKKKMK